MFVKVYNYVLLLVSPSELAIRFTSQIQGLRLVY
ncbi:hypothetical protein BD809_10193 [Aquimarina intermedia]|uniref:Uncharacterized protein n=1 Tax=Aquimarina intermedia TaxID=350814 RepID=A0A5S5CC72_9FLAO|nr:hypothetical protein BD809_10193 [Aquimarina intermedia]